MTAEIAVINKTAIALAADSAVTIGRGAVAKIYNSVNKIFELHHSAPVGIMIYGRMDYMGLPLETLVKQYRNFIGDTRFQKITDYRDSFVKWLSTEVPISLPDEEIIVMMIAYDIVEQLNSKVESEIFSLIRQSAKYLKSKDNAIANEVAKKELDALKLLPKMPYCDRAYAKEVETKFGAAIDKAIDELLKSLTPTAETRRAVHKVVVEAICRQRSSSFVTGIVIAGFGEKEICPSLERFEMEGVIAGRLKHLHGPGVDIGRRGPHADAIGFAQDDMIDRFLHGIDPELHTYAEDLIRKSILETAKEILAAQSGVSASSVTIPPALQSVLDKFAADQIANLSSYRDKEYTQQIKTMIRYMPKQEIAMLAKALIELTSLKRKVSREKETVGGEVDVAVISKSEGFVWVQRKHYFPSEINPRFMARHYPR